MNAARTIKAREMTLSAKTKQAWNDHSQQTRLRGIIAISERVSIEAFRKRKTEACYVL